MWIPDCTEGCLTFNLLDEVQRTPEPLRWMSGLRCRCAAIAGGVCTSPGVGAKGTGILQKSQGSWLTALPEPPKACVMMEAISLCQGTWASAGGLYSFGGFICRPGVESGRVLLGLLP